MMRNFFIIAVVLLVFTEAKAQQKFTLSGHIKDAANGEDLIGANVVVQKKGVGTVTNVYGFYSLTLPAGTYAIDFSYVGYEKITRDIKVDQNQTINIELNALTEKLNEVVVTATESNGGISVQDLEMSVNKLSMKSIEKLPALLGEVDVVKSLQFLPGVSSVGEGSSGFNVRGGSVGQNLILLDEAPIFNSSHMMGFFSVFNPDAVKDVKLYKGGIPAQYGGRLSSVLDVRLNEGNAKEVEVNGGIGMIFSRLSVEAPIVKDKSSFLLAARRSYIDVLADAVSDNMDNLRLNFYDITLKTNYKFNDNNRLYLSGFLGRDNFGFTEDSKFNWGNKTATLRWNHVVNSRLFANVSAVFSNYNYHLGFDEDDDDSYDWQSSITNYMIKPEFSYFISNTSELKFGLEGIYYQFNPSKISGVTNGTEVDNSLEKQYAAEWAAYVSHKVELSSRVEMQYGLRWSHFSYLGPGTAYTYNDTIAGERRSVVSETYYDDGETIASYSNFEPRFSVKYTIDSDQSIKASYNRMSQYVHFISNTSASNPLNIWTPSTNNLKPTVGDQVALGYFRSLMGGMFEMSAEVYYKKSEDEVDYIDGAELLNNEYLEGDLLSGEGRAYGLEFYLEKKRGDFTGWVSYTLSKAEVQVDGINNGDWYPTRFDQTHNLKVVGAYEVNPQWSVTADFSMSTGTPTTFPDQRYVSQGILIPYNSDNSRNDLRLSTYHRLDLSLRHEGRKYKRNGEKRKVSDYWVFSIYNVYGRKNPFSIYFSQSDDRVAAGSPIESEAHSVSIIGTMVPSFSYNFRF